MFWFLLKRKLSSYIDGELDPKTAERIKRYIETNKKCREDYEKLQSFIAFGNTFRPKESKDDLWKEVEKRISTPPDVHTTETKFKRGFFQNPKLAWGTGLGIAALITFFVIIRTFSESEKLDLSVYINGVTVADDIETAFSAFSAKPDDFQDGSKETDSNIFAFYDILTQNPPLGGHNLAVHNVKKDAHGDITQMFFQGSVGFFSIFLVPRRIDIEFGPHSPLVQDLENPPVIAQNNFAIRVYTMNRGGFTIILISSFPDSNNDITISNYLKRMFQ